MTLQRQARTSWVIVGGLLLAASRVGAQASVATGELLPVPAWAYPTTSKEAVVAKAPYDSVTPLRLKGSRRTFTLSQTKNQNTPPDWYPNRHARMPVSVAHGRVGSMSACGFCHLPDGEGRSENAMLAGLPADYILRQLDDMKSGARTTAMPGWGPFSNMHRVADSVTATEARDAAEYFARVPVRRHYAVVERAEIPAVYQVAFVYAVRKGGGTEPIDGRLIEIADDLERHELRDPKATYTAFVPLGSVAAGKRIAMAREKTPLRACASCHGPSLLGIGPIPPIAGRSPTYLLRQLLAFRNGARATATSAPMQAVAASLDMNDMIAVSAYAGSLRPSR
jgi:cytochrome c553